MSIYSNKNFILLFISRSMAVLANAFLFVSLLKWTELNTNGTSSLLLLFLVFYIPGALFSYFIGTWVEKRPLQLVMINSEILRIFLYIYFILFMNQISIYFVITILFIDALLMMFFYPANQSLLPQLITEKESRAKPVSMLELVSLSSQILGSIVAGWLLINGIKLNTIVTIAIVLLITSVFLVSNIKPFIRNKQVEAESFLTMFRSGINYVSKVPILLITILLFSVYWSIDSSTDLINIEIIVNLLNEDVEDLVFLNSTYFIGSAIGTVIMYKLHQKAKTLTLLMLSFAMYIVYFTCNYFYTHYAVLLGLFLVIGTSTTVLNISMIRFIQESVEKSYYSRVFGFFSSITNIASVLTMIMISIGILKLELNNLFIILFLLCIVSFAVCLFINKKHK